MQTQLLTRQEEIFVGVEDVQKMRKAFAGFHVDPRRQKSIRVHLESGQAFMTDGLRMHTIPVKYPSHLGIDISWDDLKTAWSEKQSLTLLPNYSTDSLLEWQEIIPKADLGVLCDIELWMPILAQIRGWGWCHFQFHRHDTLIQPLASNSPEMLKRLPHLMYKGKNVPCVEERIFNPQYIYDVFCNAKELGDSRVFLCVVSRNLTAPLLCRGNNSALLALVLAKK